ncbi:hypothetical protein FOA52_013940 [Chlamydomonas sp. UWO 241]|nr:hypothetical protein FOA52_013940 [Chlamydomonas sp. UWO 241]
MPGIHVIGSGSVGLLVAWHLRHMKIPVTLLMRNAEAATAIVAAGGVQLEYQGDPAAAEEWLSGHASPPRHAVAVETATPGGGWHALGVGSGGGSSSRGGPITQLVVATKAADTVPALLSVSSRLSPAANVLLLQNGALGVFPEVHARAVAPGHTPAGLQLSIGSVTHGAYRRGPDHVVQSCMGAIKLAPADPGLADLADAKHQSVWPRLGLMGLLGGRVRTLEQQQSAIAGGSLLRRLIAVRGLNAELVPSHAELMQQVHRKLAINCAVNAGTALLGVFNCEYTQSAWGRRLVHDVCVELFGIFGPQLLGFERADELAEYVLQVASGTGRNKNSMLQDVEAGRPTEVDYLNGYVVTHARALGLDAPVNSLLHALIKAKEAAASRGQAAVEAWEQDAMRSAPVDSLMHALIRAKEEAAMRERSTAGEEAAPAGREGA